MPDFTPLSGDFSHATPEVQKYRPRACQSCARSKMRCVWPSEPGATPCQRCAKIKAPCTLPEINPRRRRGPSTRVGQLEEKIDGIMSLLNASQQIQQNSPSSSGQTPPSSGTAPPPPLDQGRNTIQQLLNPNLEFAGLGGAGTRTNDMSEATSNSSPANNFQSLARLIPPAGLVAPASIAAGTGPNTGTNSPNLASDRDGRSITTPESVEIISGFRVTFLEADRALNLYRSVYSPYFPFVIIPAMRTAYDLYEQSPFLFRTIVAVTTPQSPVTQTDFKAWFREYVAQHVVINNERRLEILQAILIHLAWGEFYFLLDTQATNLIQLAVALVIDLGLNRSPLDFSKASFVVLRDAMAHSGIKTSRKKKHTLEEMRAALGTFYVTSLCFGMFKRYHQMGFNSYLSKCRDELEHAQEYDSDKFLIALVKIQHTLNRGADILPHSHDEEERRVQYTPFHMVLTSMQKELEALVRQQPEEVECNALLWTHYHATICRLFEPVIFIQPLTSSTSYDPGEVMARTSALWQCLHSARDFFSAYLSIPPQNLACMPFQSAHISFCIVTLVRLLFFGDVDALGPNNNARDPDWTPALARQSVDFEMLCLRISDFFDEADKVSASLGRPARYIDRDRSVMGMYRDKIRWMRSWYVGRIKPGGNLPSFRHADGSGDRGGGGGGVGNGGGGDISSKDRGGDSLGSGGGNTLGGSNVSTGGQAMDVDYEAQQVQYMMPGELDESFWQAMFDWGWNGSLDMMEVQN